MAAVDVSTHFNTYTHAKLTNLRLPPEGPPQASPEPDNCETQTGDICFYRTSVSAVTTDEATTTTTTVLTSCGTVVGCDAQGTSTATTTTASSTRTNPVYAIYPKDGNDEEQTDRIADSLKDYVGEGAELEASTTETFGLNYWHLRLNSSSVEDVRNIEEVCWSTISPSTQLGNTKTLTMLR